MFHGTLQPHWSLPNIDQVNQGRIRVRILQLQQVNGFPPLFKLQLIFDQVGIPLFLSKKRKLETKKKEAWIPRGNTWSHWQIKDALLCLLLIFNIEIISILPYETDKLANMCLVEFHFQWKLLLLFGTSLFEGHLHLGDKIWSRKNVHIIFVPVTSIQETTLFGGKRHFFWVRKPGLISPQGTRSKRDWPQKALITLSLHLSQWRQLSQHRLSHLNWCTSLVGMQHTIT